MRHTIPKKIEEIGVVVVMRIIIVRLRRIGSKGVDIDIDSERWNPRRNEIKKGHIYIFIYIRFDLIWFDGAMYVWKVKEKLSE